MISLDFSTGDGSTQGGNTSMLVLIVVAVVVVGVIGYVMMSQK